VCAHVSVISVRGQFLNRIRCEFVNCSLTVSTVGLVISYGRVRCSKESGIQASGDTHTGRTRERRTRPSPACHRSVGHSFGPADQPFHEASALRSPW